MIRSKYFEEATKYLENLRLHKNTFQLWKALHGHGDILYVSRYDPKPHLMAI